MTDEYIIISATSIHKRIQELDILIQNLLGETKHQFDKLGDCEEFWEFKQNISSAVTQFILERRLLKGIISGSTPLVPQIEKAFGANVCCNDCDKLTNWQDYISNLKLGI